MREKRSGRREFLESVGRGMIVAGIGYRMACDLGMAPVLAEEAPAPLDRLTFGSRERLVSLMEETPDRLLPILVRLLREGTDLKELVAAAALANARAFGGEDYVGFHTFMALSPAYHMSRELPAERRALPVLKVLYRNAVRLHEKGGTKDEVLHPVAAAELPRDRPGAEVVLDAVHRRDLAAAERAFAAITRASVEDAWNDLLATVQEAPEVHRIVLAHRAWDMLGLLGKEHAHTMLRQSLHYCVKNEEHSSRYFGGLRPLLPKLLDQYKLLERPLGTREADDAWVDRTSQMLFRSTPEGAAEAVAASLAEGMSPEAVGEAISLCANQLVLRDAGRPREQAQPNKPAGSVHGDSIGVHACDSANAWRNVARASSQRNAAASLVLAGYQVALDRVSRGGSFLEWKPRPHPEELEKVTAKEPAKLLLELEGAVREKNQDGACAIVERYSELGHPARAVFEVLLGYSTSEDGALHAEKYYRTASDEFAHTRAAFRGRQLVALARVVASGYGSVAPGYAEACRLLGV